MPSLIRPSAGIEAMLRPLPDPDHGQARAQMFDAARDSFARSTEGGLRGHSRSPHLDSLTDPTSG